MLNRIGNMNQMCAEIQPSSPIHKEMNRYERNELEDMKKAVEYLYEFKEKLNKLNPIVTELIDNMLQRPRY